MPAIGTPAVFPSFAHMPKANIPRPTQLETLPPALFSLASLHQVNFRCTGPFFCTQDVSALAAYFSQRQGANAWAEKADSTSTGSGPEKNAHPCTKDFSASSWFRNLVHSVQGIKEFFFVFFFSPPGS